MKKFLKIMSVITLIIGGLYLVTPPLRNYFTSIGVEETAAFSISVVIVVEVALVFFSFVKDKKQSIKLSIAVILFDVTIAVIFGSFYLASVILCTIDLWWPITALIFFGVLVLDIVVATFVLCVIEEYL